MPLSSQIFALTGFSSCPRHPSLRIHVAACLVGVACVLQSACTIIHIHSDSPVATRVLPGLAIVSMTTRVGTASYVHVSTFGLSMQQQGFVFGLANTETIYADPQNVCFSLELKQSDTFFKPSAFSYRSTPKETP